MDSATVVTTFALLAFLVERLTNAVFIALGYWPAWSRVMESGPVTDPAGQARNQRNRRTANFLISAVLAVGGAWVLEVDVLGPLGVSGIQGIRGYLLTGLLVAAGADPIRELLSKRPGGDGPAAPAPPLEVTGTLVLQHAPDPAAGLPERRPGPDVRAV